MVQYLARTGDSPANMFECRMRPEINSHMESKAILNKKAACQRLWYFIVNVDGRPGHGHARAAVRRAWHSGLQPLPLQSSVLHPRGDDYHPPLRTQCRLP